MIRRSKRGITLVELVICCAIVVLLGSACLTVLLAGGNVFNKGAQSATASLDADVLQTFMMQQLPSADCLTQVEKAEAGQLTGGNCLYMDADTFYIRTNGSDISLPSVAELAYAVIRAGDPLSDSARPQLVYTVTLSDGTSFTGGFVMTSMTYDESTMSRICGVVSENPLSFSLSD